MNDELIYKIFEDICKIENLKDKDGNWSKDAKIQDVSRNLKRAIQVVRNSSQISEGKK